MSRYRREIAATVALAALLATVALIAPSFFSPANARDLALNNAPALIVATGMTFVILTGQIDISVGSQFAVASITAGVLAKAGLPMPAVALAVVICGCAMGAVNGVLVARWRIPSIVATLAMMVVLRDALRWATEGAWVQNLPPDFQWFGLGQTAGVFFIVLAALLIFAASIFLLGRVAAGRAVYAVGANSEAARLAGIDPRRITFGVFVWMGALTALAAFLNAARFAEVPGNAGVGLELKAIAAVVVGGTAITGGRGTLAGTLAGAALLAVIGPALAFLGVNPFWEKALQGAIILAALLSEIALGRIQRHAQFASR
jgi:rhamnose transport system permease protein